VLVELLRDAAISGLEVTKDVRPLGREVLFQGSDVFEIPRQKTPSQVSTFEEGNLRREGIKDRVDDFVDPSFDSSRTTLWGKVLPASHIKSPGGATSAQATAAAGILLHDACAVEAKLGAEKKRLARILSALVCGRLLATGPHPK